VAKAGCEGAGFHGLRRAKATMMVASGVDLKTAQTRFEHSDPRLTSGLYADALDAADVLGSLLHGPRDGRAMVGRQVRGAGR
jgi:integrase